MQVILLRSYEIFKEECYPVCHNKHKKIPATAPDMQPLAQALRVA